MSADVVGHESDTEDVCVVDWMADWISKQEVVSADVLRAVKLRTALQGILRWQRGHGEKDFYLKSFPTLLIDEFWSHSWQTRPFRKVTTVLLLKRGLPAGIVGTGAALLGGLLSGLELLAPTFPFGETSLWATIFGFVAFVTTLVTWPGRENIFLDACCIHQTNPKKKVEAIRSMSGILKRSQKMLVLWDKTYVERLWCMFELAAFLQRGDGASVAIRPTLLGPCVLAIFFSVSTFFILVVAFFSYGWTRGDMIWVTGLAVAVLTYPAAAIFRGYFHSVQTVQDQLRDFRLSKTKCYCCSINHVMDNGTPLPLCDREILGKCIAIWFGSEENFEKDAGAMVLESFTDQLGHHYFPYWLWLVATLPGLWVLLDVAVDHMRQDHSERHRWPYWFVFALGWWIGALPSCAAAFFYICKALGRAKSGWKDFFTNFLVVLIMQPIFACTFLLIERLFEWMLPLSPWLSAIISSSIHITMALILWNAPAIPVKL